jgi:hypothetical protein
MMPWQQSERRCFRRHLHSSKSAHGRTKAENRRCGRPYSAFSVGGVVCGYPTETFPERPAGCQSGLPFHTAGGAFATLCPVRPC